MTVLGPQVGHGRDPFESHVLHPFAHLLHRTAAHIAVDISLAPQLAAQFHELMRSEAVVLHHTAPVGVDHLFAGLFGADTVLPVILVRKAAAGPAQHRDLHLFQRLHHIIAHTVGIGNLGIFPHVQPLIDAPAQMLGEMSLDLGVDMTQLMLRIYV